METSVLLHEVVFFYVQVHIAHYRYVTGLNPTKVMSTSVSSSYLYPLQPFLKLLRLISIFMSSPQAQFSSFH